MTLNTDARSVRQHAVGEPGTAPSQEPVKGSALDIPAEPLTGSRSISLARSARLTRYAVRQRVQNSRLGPHNGLIERLQLDDGRAVIAADPERHRVRRVVHPQAPDVGLVGKQIFRELTGPDIEAHDSV